MEWVEVKGRTVEVAVEAALAELGLPSVDLAEVEVIQQPDKGFLGIGRSDAVVRVKAKPKKRKRRRKPQEGREGSRGGDGRKRQGGQQQRRQKAGNGQNGKQSSGRQGSGKPKRTEDKPKAEKKPRRPQRQEETMDRDAVSADDAPEATMDDRVEVVDSFLKGLVDAFGLEGEVKTHGEDGIVFASVDGPQTEALIGPRGSIMQSVHEITRTVAQRKIREGTRLRLDIAGYAERRREALQIYAQRLAEQLLEDGGEVMLEPMNPSDRKVIHDAIGEIDGVRSYSEGEEPHRSVVVSAE
ncbi:MAG: RNA-binding cell elongation regulator Jag/EloR [Acidimicrobiia bacterium]